MTKIGLMTCPFCGAASELVEMIEIDEGEHAASCLCGAIGPSRPTPEAATAAWNGDKLVGMQAMGPVSGSAYHQARTLVRTGRVL